MSAKKVYHLLLICMIAIGLVGVLGIVVGNKILSTKSADISNLRLKQQVLLQQSQELVQAEQSIVKYTPLNNIAETVVPQEKDQALAVRELTNFAAAANIGITSVSFPASNLGTSTAASSTSGTGSGSSSPSPPPSQLQHAVGISGIYILPITIQSDTNNPITYSQLINFLQELENDRHTAEVSQLTITPSATNSQLLSFTIVVNIYVK